MSKVTRILLAATMLLWALGMAARGYANDDDLDNYKFRINAEWWFSQPGGYFGLANSNNYIDFHRDFGFGSYSTFTGKLDWHFKHKHHFLFNASPVNSTKTSTITRQIMFQGQTYDLGAQVTAKIQSLVLAPGYQYDIIRRNHGFLGVEVDFNFLQTKASLTGEGTVNGITGIRSSSKSFFAPLPVFGPVFRWYPLHDSNRLSIDGSVRGMPFFGYGNFVTAKATVGVGITEHLAVRAGYTLGSRLSIHGTSDQIAIELSQKGPTAGIEYSWGESPEKKVHVAQPGENVISEWHVEWVPFYLWFSGLSGTVGAQGNQVPVSVSFSQVLSNLNIGLMSVLDVRRKRIGLLTDLVFISLSSPEQTTPIQGGAYSGFKANAKTFWIDPELYFRVIDKPLFSVDATGGGRFWRLDNSISLSAGTLAAADIGQTQSWVDPVLGARFRVNLPKESFVLLKGDAGGFGVGSQLTYQIYAVVGKEFKKKFSAMLGYRYLDVDYKNGGFLYDTHMSGLLAGFSIRLK
ncbi:MAG TPA: hypothetical protein VGF19_05115 [Candidatus Acidoferrum sp.]